MDFRKLNLCIVIILLAYLPEEAFAQFTAVQVGKSPTNMEIYQIDEYENSTLVYIKYIRQEGIDLLNVNENISAKLKGNSKEYHLINGINIPISTQAETRNLLFERPEQVHCFALEFEKIPSGSTFDIIDDAENYYGLNFYDVCADTSKSGEQVNINALCNAYPVKESGSFIHDDMRVQYVRANGITLTMYLQRVKEYGKYYQAHMELLNQSGKSILLGIDNVTAEGYLLKDQKRKSIPMEVLSALEYDKKVARKQSWNNAMLALAGGMAAGVAGYSSSYTTYTGSLYGSAYTTSYNGTSAYLAQMQASETAARYASDQQEVRQHLNDGYVKTNTIKNQVEYSGFFNIEYKKLDDLKVNIKVNGVDFPFMF